MENEVESGPVAGGSNLIATLRTGVWRFRWLILGAVGVGMVVGLFRGLVVPNQYRSIGKLFVRPGIRESITPEAAFSGESAGAVRLGGREAILNELQVLTAPQLFDQAVVLLGADVVLAPYDPAAGSGGSVSWPTKLFHNFQSWWFASASSTPGSGVDVDRSSVASQLLANSVAIYPETGASVISFAYVSHSPELARTVVNAVLEAAKQMHRDVFDTMSSLGTIEEEMKSSELIARGAETVLRDFRLEKGIYDYESQRDELLAYLGRLDGQIDTIDIDIGRRKAERASLATLLLQIPEERIVQGTESSSLNPVYGTLTSFLLQLRMADLNFDDANKNLPNGEIAKRRAALDSLIAETSSRLQSEGMQLKLDGTREENPNHVRLKQRHDDLGAELDGLASQKVGLEAVRATRRTGLASFEALSPQLRTLELDARQKRATADRLTEGVAGLRTVQRLEQLNLSNIQVMHGGTLEANRIAPQRSQLVMFGGVAGGALGIALALLLAFRDPKVRGREDLPRLGMPVEGLHCFGAAGMVTPRAGDLLPASLADARADIAGLWSSLPYDRRATEALKIGFVACGQGVDAGRAAATLAIGLAIHGGERVVYVSCVEGASWVARRLGLPVAPGWSEVLRGEATLEDALVEVAVPGLSCLPIGRAFGAVPHPMAGPRFIALLDTLSAKYRFVVIELPDLNEQPEGRSVLGIIDAAELVVCAGTTGKVDVRNAVAAIRTAGARLLGGVLQPVVAREPQQAAELEAPEPAE